MTATPAIFEDFIDDDLERQQLRASIYEPTSQADPHHRELEGLQHQLSIYARSMSPLHRNIVQMFFRGHPKPEIIEQLGTSYPTINKALNSPKGLRLLSLMGQVSELRAGPAFEARRAMLWRIAKRAEIPKPSVALKALDILNRQAGDYANEEASDGGIKITVKQFVMNMIANNPDLPRDIADHRSPTTIDGEFTKVKVPISDG